MMEENIYNAGAVPWEVSADAEYYSARAAEELTALGVDPLIAPERTHDGTVPPPVPSGRIPRHLSARDRMRRKLQNIGDAGVMPCERKRWAGIWPDQAGPWLPAVSAVRIGEGQRGMVADLRRPQPVESVPVRLVGG